jgi:hypothetical protein
MQLLIIIIVTELVTFLPMSILAQSDNSSRKVKQEKNKL